MTYNQGILLAGVVIVNCGSGSAEVGVGWVLVGLAVFFGATDMVLEIIKAKKGVA